MSIACAREKCSATICLSPEIEQRVRRTHESFLCPFGHSNYFPGKTDEEKRIEQLERSVRRWRELYDEALSEWGRCPVGCGWQSHSGVKMRWMSMLRHLFKSHGNMLPHKLLFAYRHRDERKAA